MDGTALEKDQPGAREMNAPLEPPIVSTRSINDLIGVGAGDCVLTERIDFLKQVVFSGDRRLLPHQIEQAVFAFEHRHSINSSATGTGKFLVALAMRRLVEHEAGHTVKCLYTSPKSALGQFEQELI